MFTSPTSKRRRAFVALLALAAIFIPTTAYATHTFSDVEDGRYYTEPVEWAFDNGITTGKTETSFDPAGVVTRGEAVTFLQRYHDNVAANLDTLGALSCTSEQVPKWDGDA